MMNLSLLLVGLTLIWDFSAAADFTSSDQSLFFNDFGIGRCRDGVGRFYDYLQLIDTTAFTGDLGCADICAADFGLTFALSKFVGIDVNEGDNGETKLCRCLFSDGTTPSVIDGGSVAVTTKYTLDNVGAGTGDIGGTTLLINNQNVGFPQCYAANSGENSESSMGGDPHVTTWKNEHFEYHGQCDLSLVKDAEFADGLGLDVQIRTKIVRYWSYIKNIAIKIDSDILEIEGSAGADDVEAHYWINYEFQGDFETFAGFPVTQELPSVYKRKYIIDLGSKYPGSSIVIQLYKEFVRVKFVGDEEVFGNTVGLMGDYKTGELIARDGSTVMTDFTEFGDEWQVLPREPKLFHEFTHPQFPELCIKPEDPRGERKRRLAESTVSIEQAEAACEPLKDPLSIKDCVYDILATQDLDMVGAF